MPMEPAVRRETDTIVASSFDWLFEAGHGTTVTAELDVTTFVEATHYPNGYIPAGILVGRVTASPGLVGLYADAATGGRDTAYGILMADVPVHAGATRVQVPVLTKDAILIESRLPDASGITAAARTDLAAVNITSLAE